MPSYKDATLRSHSLLVHSQSVKHQQINAFQSFSHLNASGRNLLSLFCSHQGRIWSQEEGFCFFSNKATSRFILWRAIQELIWLWYVDPYQEKVLLRAMKNFSTKKKGLMTSSMHPESQLKSTSQMVHLSDKYISPTVFKFLLFTFTTLYRVSEGSGLKTWLWNV